MSLILLAMPTLIIKAGRVLDPASGIDRTADVAITDGRITAIDADLDAARERVEEVTQDCPSLRDPA